MVRLSFSIEGEGAPCTKYEVEVESPEVPFTTLLQELHKLKFYFRLHDLSRGGDDIIDPVKTLGDYDMIEEGRAYLILAERLPTYLEMVVDAEEPTDPVVFRVRSCSDQITYVNM
jgi:hypothetical protein